METERRLSYIVAQRRHPLEAVTNHPLISIGLAIGAVFTALNFSVEEVREAERYYVDTYIESVKDLRETCRNLCGTSIESGEIKDYMTDTYDRQMAIVRSKPTSSGKILGYAPKEQLVIGEPYFGTQYAAAGSRTYNQGQIKGPDDNIYGTWFKLPEVMVLARDDNGVISKEIVVKGGFVSGNFLTTEGVE